MRRVAIGVLVAGLLLASGCAGPRAFERDGIHLLVGPSSGMGRQALISGKLHVGEGGCVGLTKDGKSSALIIWPAGTTLSDADPVAIHIPGVGRIGLGEVISAGGGDPGPNEVLPAIPDECDARSISVIDGARWVRRGPAELADPGRGA
ncbi:hypothetical protein [Tenggerimyces flavus]|uniref:Lipoprotein n=1 Tax=Tenggerimyces flavus TaxID=1708749 RepID=A0ABV7YN78_9ACTN|nr:hypothetical protein [Tenggerimyces flavus]MBM7790378.1 hypothetical protein [Tenggerimyces flavus]